MNFSGGKIGAKFAVCAELLLGGKKVEIKQFIAVTSVPAKQMVKFQPIKEN